MAPSSPTCSRARGAAGIEALSRGAARAIFVERDRGAARSSPPTSRGPTFDGERARIVRADAVAWLGGPEAATVAPFDIVIADPPYAETALLLAALEALEPRLALRARVVAKHFWRDAPPARIGLLASERERRFGETMLTFYRRAEDR